MASFSETILINAPVSEVWKVLADIGTISDWNPGVKSSQKIGNVAEGVGAKRRCDLGGKNYLLEDVVEWSREQVLTMRITETNLPFKSADIRFTLQARAGATEVTVTPDYELKFGGIGRLLDSLIVRRTYRSGMKDLLEGLKGHTEIS